MQSNKRKFRSFPCFLQQNYYLCIIRNINGRIFHNKTKINPLYILEGIKHVKPKQYGKGKRF